MGALYHRELGLPASINEVCGVEFLFQYTKHAMKECVRDLYSPIKPPGRMMLAPAHIVEVETENNIVNKVVIRIGYNEGFDLILVLLPDVRKRIATVKTCWLNRRTDTHRTLDKTRYTLP